MGWLNMEELFIVSWTWMGITDSVSHSGYFYIASSYPLTILNSQQKNERIVLFLDYALKPVYSKILQWPEVTILDLWLIVALERSFFVYIPHAICCMYEWQCCWLNSEAASDSKVPSMKPFMSFGHTDKDLKFWVTENLKVHS